MLQEEKYCASSAAKINLSLVVTGKRDGLHELDSVLCGVDIFDTAEFVPTAEDASKGNYRDMQHSSGLDISVKSDLSGFDEDKFKAGAGEKIRLAAEKLGVCGKMEIVKNVPYGAGLGGSSSAIAAAILAMEKFLSKNDKNNRLDSGFLLSLGSDVPYAVRGGTCKVRGVGEIVEPLEYRELYFLVLLSSFGVDSAAAYALYDKTYEQGLAGKYLDKAFTLPPRDVEEALFVMQNDLEEASELLNPQILIAKQALKHAGAEKIIMCGSGSAVAAVFERECERDGAAVRVNFPGRVLKLKSCGSCN